MFFDSFRNCNAFFTTRPPAVVFVICLVILMVTTFSFTFYITQKDKISNSDAEANWKSLRKHLNRNDLCIGNSSYGPNRQPPHVEEEISFITWISINGTNLKNGSKVQAFYDLYDWHSRCPIEESNTLDASVLKVSFDVLDSNKVCAIVEGPVQFLPKYSEPDCNPHNLLKSDGIITLYSRTKDSLQFCSNVTQMKFNFVQNKDDSFDIFLNETDRNVIYLHLMWFSYLLLFSILIVLIYAIFYHKETKLQRLV